MVERGVKLAHLCKPENEKDDPNCLWKSQRAEKRDIIELIKDVMVLHVNLFIYNFLFLFGIDLSINFIYVFLQMAEHGTLSQRQYLQRVRDGYAREDCLTDNWVGHSR